MDADGIRLARGAARGRALWRLLLVLAVAALPPTFAAGQQDLTYVVVHPSVPPQALSRSVLRAVFGMRLRKWSDDTPVRVFVLHPDNPLHAQFAKQALNVYPHQLRRAWDRLVYSGTGQAPTEVASQREMRDRVASTPGAIGYLTGEWIDDGVRILPVK
jgi:hypothetical protein